MLKKQFWDFETKCRLELLLGILNSTFIRPVKTDQCYSFILYGRAALAWSKEKPGKNNNIHLEMRNLKQKEQKKNYKRKKKRSSVTEDKKSQRQATLKTLKRGDENETSLYLCTASLYLEKVVASKQLKFAMETDVERKARLEKMVATTQLSLALETEEERRAKKEMNLILI